MPKLAKRFIPHFFILLCGLFLLATAPPAQAQITLGPATLPAGAVGATYAQLITATGAVAPVHFTVSSGTLPVGLKLGAPADSLFATIGGVPTNNRPGVYQPTDTGGRVGLSRGTPPQAGDPTGAPGQNPTPQMEIGDGQDMFAVYRGKQDNALNTSPVWRYHDKDALRTPDLPAVDAFRKAVVEAEKQRAANP